jgi:AbrB family looped-hinge helix DNA binding protein
VARFDERWLVRLGGYGYCEGVTENSEYNQVFENVPPVEFEPTKQGRVVIPAQMRRVLGWDEGGPLVMYVEDNRRVVIEPRAQLAKRTQQEVDAAWRGTEESVTDELIADRRAEAAREDES